jgi:glutathione synthase/RimK-type ligase-like ATP-grasp enzyme
MSKGSQPVTTIGSTEPIDFPEHGLFGVPAKVDTGADSSAIWASDIRELRGGKLSFCLFDTSSPFYTGKIITVPKYSVASVKNSFGHTEFRFKVPLKVSLAGRTINVRFTLANRANNRYPILIGRRTLHGKFLVDVSRGPDRQEPYRVLLITISRTERIKEFIGRVNKTNPNIQVSLAVYDDLQFIIGKAPAVLLAETGEDIAHFDMVHFKATPRRRMDIAAAAGQYLKKRNVPFIDTTIMTFPGTSKLYQYMLLANHDITVPPSVFVATQHLQGAYSLFAETLGTPFVLKDIYGSRGRENHLVSSEKDFAKVAKRLAEQEVSVIAQQFVDNDGDYRLLTFGRKIALVIFRQRQDKKTHLNNTSQGGKATLVPVESLPVKLQQDSITAAKVLEREIAGVDMMQDKRSGTWYCLEVNEDPQIASGAFISDKAQAYATFLESEIEK